MPTTSANATIPTRISIVMLLLPRFRSSTHPLPISERATPTDHAELFRRYIAHRTHGYSMAPERKPRRASELRFATSVGLLQIDCFRALAALVGFGLERKPHSFVQITNA